MSFEIWRHLVSTGAQPKNFSEHCSPFEVFSTSAGSTTESELLEESMWAHVGLLAYELATYTFGPYVVPVLIALGLVNNAAAIALLHGGRKRARQLGISESMREYYVALVVADLFTLLSSHIWDFAGAPRSRT